jgi:hypothetical protein
MHLRHRVLLLATVALCCARAQEPAGGSPPGDPVTPVQVQQDKRAFGVIPNNRTTESSIPFHSISPRQKMMIAVKDSIDWTVFSTAAAFAGLYQIQDQNPSFGQGVNGYAKRFGTSYGDQIIGNILVEGFIPSVFHQDPRYFRSGQGSMPKRTWYALSRIVVARMDSGRNTFNFSEWGGNAAATAISNAYYPDTRTVSENVQRLLIACGTDAFSNVLKEFWPDVKRKLFEKKDKH